MCHVTIGDREILLQSSAAPSFFGVFCRLISYGARKIVFGTIFGGPKLFVLSFGFKILFVALKFFKKKFFPAP